MSRPIRRFIRDVLTIEKFAEMRKRGMSYAAIGKVLGFSRDTTSRYGREALPEELQSHSTRILVRARAQAQGKPMCKRCGLLGEPRNPVDEESGLCLYCRLELAGVDLLAWHEMGGAAATVGIVGAVRDSAWDRHNEAHSWE